MLRYIKNINSYLLYECFIMRLLLPENIVGDNYFIDKLATFHYLPLEYLYDSCGIAVVIDQATVVVFSVFPALHNATVFLNGLYNDEVEKEVSNEI